MLNVMASRLLMGRCKVHQYDFETGYAILTECMNTAMAKFGERSIAVVEALLAQAEYCFLQAIYPSTDTILIKVCVFDWSNYCAVDMGGAICCFGSYLYLRLLVFRL